MDNHDFLPPKKDESVEALPPNVEDLQADHLTSLADFEIPDIPSTTNAATGVDQPAHLLETMEMPDLPDEILEPVRPGDSQAADPLSPQAIDPLGDMQVQPVDPLSPHAADPLMGSQPMVQDPLAAPATDPLAATLSAPSPAAASGSIPMPVGPDLSQGLDAMGGRFEGAEEELAPSDAPAKKGLLSFLGRKKAPATPASDLSEQPPSAAPGQPHAGQPEAPQSALQKFKVPIGIAAVVLVAMGWQHLKSQQEAAQAQQAAAANASNDPYDLALQEMQNGAPEALGAANAMPFMEEGEELDVFAGGEPVVAGAEGAGQAMGLDAFIAGGADAQVAPDLVEGQATAPVSEPAPIAQDTTSVADSAASAVNDQAAQALIMLQGQLAKAHEEISSLKSQLAQAEKATKQTGAAKSVTSAKPAAKPAVKPAAKPVATPSAPKAKPAVVAKVAPKKIEAPRRSDIEFLGAFRDGNAVRAHALIGNTVMELTQGQKIGSIKVESVSMEGVTINGHIYR